MKLDTEKSYIVYVCVCGIHMRKFGDMEEALERDFFGCWNCICKAMRKKE